jgi:hypothetical protein
MRVVARATEAAPDSIGVLSGRKEAHKLDAASGKQGWFAKLTHIGPDFGDLDAGHLKDYAELPGPVTSGTSTTQRSFDL